LFPDELKKTQARLLPDKLKKPQGSLGPRGAPSRTPLERSWRGRRAGGAGKSSDADGHEGAEEDVGTDLVRNISAARSMLTSTSTTRSRSGSAARWTRGEDV
jgi:hypothetical protein